MKPKIKVILKSHMQGVSLLCQKNFWRGIVSHAEHSHRKFQKQEMFVNDDVKKKKKKRQKQK